MDTVIISPAIITLLHCFPAPWQSIRWDANMLIDNRKNFEHLVWGYDLNG